MFETYKPSGRFGVLALPFTLIGMAVCVALAFVYYLLLEYIPFIYLNFLITLGAGVTIAFVGGFVVSIGHVRNTSVAFLIGLALMSALLGGKFWFQYRSLLDTATTMVMQENQFPEESRNEVKKTLANELTFFEHIKIRVEEGWSIGRAGGAQVSGVFVYVIWLIEAGIMFFLGALVVAGAAREPYSEKMGKWADEEQAVMTLPINSQEMVQQIRAATSVDQLLEIPIPTSDVSAQHAVYKVNSIEGHEMEDAYLSVDLVTTSVKGDGEQEHQVDPLVKHAILSSAQRHRLVENASLLQEAIADYQQAMTEETLGGSNDDSEEDEAKQQG